MIFTVALDITKRKRAEEALRDSEARFRELFDCAPVAYHELDTDGTVRRVNRAECALLGYQPGEMVGRPVWDFIAGGERGTSRGELRQRLSGEQSLEPYQRRYLRRDGGELWIEIHNSLVRNTTGETVGILTALLDITERQRAQAALQDSEERNRLLFEYAVSAVAVHEIVLDAAGRPVDYVFLSANPAFEKQTGLRVADILGRRVSEVLPGLEKTSLIGIYGKVALTGEAVTFEQYSEQLARHFFINAYRVGERRFAAVFHDITERKRMAEAVELHAEQLARSNAELERFAYVASHDLQEPLRMVASFTQLLAKRYSGKLDETADRYIDYAVDGARRMQQLIAELLAYSRVNSKELDLRQTDCEAVVQTTLQNLSAAMDESGAVVERDTLPVLMADPAQLGQLFQNLIGNAIKFRGQAPHGSISQPPITVHTGCFPSRITASESTRGIPTGSSRSSSACTPGRNTPAPGSGSRSARRSPSGTGERSGWNPSPGWDPRSVLQSQNLRGWNRK